MKSIFSSVLLLLLAFPARGDGPPIDHKTGKITYPHSVVDLNSTQANELDTVGTVTLTSEQWAALRKVSKATPRRIQEVIPVTWNDCLCGVHGDYGIALGPKRIAILHRNWNPGSLAWTFAHTESLELRIDRRGQFYFRDALIPYPTLLSGFSEASAERKSVTGQSSRKPSLFVRLPLGMDEKSVTLKSRLDEIYELAGKEGWETPFRATES